MSEISVSKAGLEEATGQFEEICKNILSQIQVITDSLGTIDSNWSGPEHNNAVQDKKNAEDNMEKAINTINSMNGAIAKLSTNANKISYND